MIVWRDYLSKLANEGVSLNSVEDDDLTEEGERLERHFLSRLVAGQFLNFLLPGPVDMDAPVSRYLRRQIANVLRLPPKKYIFPDEREPEDETNF